MLYISILLLLLFLYLLLENQRVLMSLHYEVLRRKKLVQEEVDKLNLTSEEFEVLDRKLDLWEWRKKWELYINKKK